MPNDLGNSLARLRGESREQGSGDEPGLLDVMIMSYPGRVASACLTRSCCAWARLLGRRFPGASTITAGQVRASLSNLGIKVSFHNVVSRPRRGFLAGGSRPQSGHSRPGEDLP